MRLVWALVGAAYGCGCGWGGEIPDIGQTPNFSADRPGLGISSELVPSGFLQFEGGVGYYSERGGKRQAHTFSYGSPTLRYGVSRRLELRLEGKGYETVESGLDREFTQGRGWSDVSLGAKLRVAEEHGWIPALVLVPMISAPSGAEEFTSAGWDPSLGLGWAHNIPAGIGLSGAFSLASVSGEVGRYWQRAVVLSAAHDVAAGWNGYIEAQRVNALDRGLPGEWMAGAGACHKVGKAAQIDVQLGHSVGGWRSAWFVSVGFALRAPGPLFR